MALTYTSETPAPSAEPATLSEQLAEIRAMLARIEPHLVYLSGQLKDYEPLLAGLRTGSLLKAARAGRHG